MMTEPKQPTHLPDVTKLSNADLQAKIEETRSLVCNNFNLCSSILDMKMRELHLLVEERDRRKEVDDGV
jgi:hypothetical protein